jgi:hypothetical protein
MYQVIPLAMKSQRKTSHMLFVRGNNFYTIIVTLSLKHSFGTFTIVPIVKDIFIFIF